MNVIPSDDRSDGTPKVPKTRKINATSSLAKTLGRSFKIRKSSISTAIPTVLFNKDHNFDVETENQNNISKLTDEQVQNLFFSELDDLIEKDNLKEQLKRKSILEMRTFLTLYKRNNLSTALSPCVYVSELITHRGNMKKCHIVLNKLLISLKSEGLSWIKKLQDHNLFDLLEIFVSLAKQFTETQTDECNVLIHALYCCTRIVHVIANTGFGFKKFCSNPSLLSIAVYFVCSLMNDFSGGGIIETFSKEQYDDVRRIQRIAIELLTVFIHQNPSVILRNFNEVAKSKNVSRFQFIIDGLINADDDSKIQYISLLSALFTCKGDDVFYRIQIRSELSRIGLFRYIKELSDGQTIETVHNAIDRLQRCTDEHYLTGINVQLFQNPDDPTALFKCLLSKVEGSASEKHLISMIHHLLLIHDNCLTRDSFYSIFDMLISRIIKLKRNVDSDDDESMSPLVWDDLSDIIHKSSLTSIGSISTIDDAQSLTSNVRTPEDLNSVSTNECGNEDLTICPEPETNRTNMCSSTCGPIANKNEDSSLINLPPPPPPPPPPPSLNRMFPTNISTGQVRLPSFLKAKKKYNVSSNMRKIQWNRIEIKDISENSLWAQVDESKYTNQSFCEKLTKEFSVCSNNVYAKAISQPVDEKLFHFLDPKSGQNLAILMSFLKAPPETICKWIMECDDTNLTLTALEQILRCIPDFNVINEIKASLEGRTDLQNPEKLLVELCQIPLLSQRIKCMIFKNQFTEMYDECKASMQKSIRACRKIRRSSEFKLIMEILLASGNYLNSASKNYECAFGFKFDFLPKVITTRASQNNRTLLHVIIDNIKEKSAIDAIIQYQKICESASRVDSCEIKKMINDICSGLENVKHFLNESSPYERSCVVLKEFLSNAESKRDQLKDLHSSMQNEHVQLSEYLSFDIKQINDFFSNLHEFICHLKQCKSDIDAAREANEKRNQRRTATQAIEKRREIYNYKRKQKSQTYNQTVVNDEDENVMDKLLAALNESDVRFVKRIPTLINSKK